MIVWERELRWMEAWAVITCNPAISMEIIWDLSRMVKDEFIVIVLS